MCSCSKAEWRIKSNGQFRAAKVGPRKLGLGRKKPTRAKVGFTVFEKDKRKNESWSLILNRKTIIPTKMSTVNRK